MLDSNDSEELLKSGSTRLYLGGSMLQWSGESGILAGWDTQFCSVYEKPPKKIQKNKTRYDK